MTADRRLIEEYLPIRAGSEGRDKWVGRRHVSTLELEWAGRSV